MCRACWHGLLKEIFAGWKVMATAVWKVSIITCASSEMSFHVLSSLCAAQWGEGWKLLSLSFVCLQNPVLCRHPSSSAGRQRCRARTVLAAWKEAVVCWRRWLGSWATRRAALWSLPEHRACWWGSVSAPRGTGLFGEGFNPWNQISRSPYATVLQYQAAMIVWGICSPRRALQALCYRPIKISYITKLLFNRKQWWL